MAILFPIHQMQGALWNILDDSGCRIAWCGTDGRHEQDGPEIAKQLVGLYVEVQRIREMIEQTADEKLVPDCDDFFCPHCFQKVRADAWGCFCDNCPNPDSDNTPPLGLFFSSCYSSKDAAMKARAG
jgi:hypothetical protein